MIEKATIKDVELIHKLLLQASRRGGVLPRAFVDLYENLRDFFVYKEKNKIVGCCALHIVWRDLAEIRSLSVDSHYRKRGIGRKLIEAALSEAKNLGIVQVFALTNRRPFFEKVGFSLIDKNSLPHKIWSDCMNCAKFPDCDEEALVFKT